jgi:1-acyl-sn-glycerol-3-phosphate acyltransferase
MKYILKPLQWIYCIYALIMFVIIMLVALPFVVVGSFFGKIKGGNFIYKVCKVWGGLWYIFVGIYHKNVYEVPHDTRRTFIFVANHNSYMDIPPIVLAINQPVRVLGKYEMVKYPIFGYIYKCAAILVDRRDAERRAKSVRQLKAALRKHISIFIFPEGTFNESVVPLKEFYDGAFRIAIETHTPIKPVLFVDAVDRLHYSSIFTLTPGKCRVVFLDEIPVAGLHMKDLPQLKETVHKIMEAGLRRYRKYPMVTEEV